MKEVRTRRRTAVATSLGPLATVALLALTWVGCDSPSAPSAGLPAHAVVDTVWLADTVSVVDTVYLSTLPDGAEPTRLAGPLAWGGGPFIASSSHIAASLPDGRWGIGTDQPTAKLHVNDGGFRVDDGFFDFFVTGDFVGENPAGYGVNLERDSRRGTGPMAINFRQDGENFWGLGLDENVVQPYPDYVSVFERTAGDIFRFRSGGRAILGKGIGHPEPNHVLTIIDRDNDFIDNVLNLQLAYGNASRLIRSWDNSREVVPFAVGADGRVGIGRDVSSSTMLAVNGEVEARAYRRVSDARLKSDVRPIEGALGRVEALRPVSFRWRDGDAGRESGLLAQQVEAVLPEAVRANADGHRTVDYQAISIELLRAVQELSAEVARLGAELQEVREGTGRR